jgi:hypothetical protein
VQGVPLGAGGLEQAPVVGSQVPAWWHSSDGVQSALVQQLLVGIQPPLQGLVPLPQTGLHEPPLQVCGAGQTVPQPPQLLASVNWLTQLPPQQIWSWPERSVPPPHVHTPFVQVSAMCGSQLTHSPPPVPHVLSDGVWQLPF